jgi:hypothetical protein
MVDKAKLEQDGIDVRLAGWILEWRWHFRHSLNVRAKGRMRRLIAAKFSATIQVARGEWNADVFCKTWDYLDSHKMIMG